jgi:hypothetical protein
MIVEFFGPPGVGKTTFARVLIARMRQEGLSAQLALSWRPAEGSPTGRRLVMLPNQSAAVIRRLGRPLVDLIAMARHPRSNRHGIGTALNLLWTLPPRSIVWTLRLSQYLCRLSSAWHHASMSDDIFLFDQAFVQALCTLILVAQSAGVDAIARAVDSVPKPDLLVRLDAPKALLEARLCDRMSTQGAIERLFEFDLQTNLESKRVIGELDNLLQERGWAITCGSSIDQSSLSDCADQLMEKIKTTLASKPKMAATGSRGRAAEAEPKRLMS